MAYTVTFWGTRGSIPTPRAHPARYGGNTPCVAVEGAGGHLVIVDAGTGIRAVGVHLVERRHGPVKAAVLLPAAHWDRVQALPHVQGGASMRCATDHELGEGGHHSTPPLWRRQFVEFLQGVDLLIHDAMYTPEELEVHRGWGHSTWAEAVGLAAEAKVKRLVLFHHEPEHDDQTLDELLAAARREAERRGGPAEVLAAQEGMHLTV